MKKTRRTLAMLLLFALLFTMPGLAASLGDQVLNSETELARGLALADGVYWGGSDFRNENYLLYTPSTEIQPIVVYGSKLCNYGSFSSMTKLLEGQGYHVIGGINADYYDVATYCPLGIVIRDGKVAKKYHPVPPQRLVNVIKCKNPRCITSIETNCDHIFELSPSGRYRCLYCNQEMPVGR